MMSAIIIQFSAYSTVFRIWAATRPAIRRKRNFPPHLILNGRERGREEEGKISTTLPSDNRASKSREERANSKQPRCSIRGEKKREQHSSNTLSHIFSNKPKKEGGKGGKIRGLVFRFSSRRWEHFDHTMARQCGDRRGKKGMLLSAILAREEERGKKRATANACREMEKGQVRGTSNRTCEQQKEGKKGRATHS